jgi:lipoyl(octanoyl) transferase
MDLTAHPMVKVAFCEPAGQTTWAGSNTSRPGKPCWNSPLPARQKRPTKSGLSNTPPVFTLGQAGKPEHLLKDIGIPVVKIDRGGQITYHGPGQVVIYLLLDLHRMKIKVRELVTAIEQAVIDFLATYDVNAQNASPARQAFMSAMQKSPRSVSRSKMAAATTACRSMSIWIFTHLRRSTLAAMLGSKWCKPKTFNIPLTANQAGEQLTQYLLLQLDKQHG